MSITILAIEIDTDPLGRGYDGMTNQQVVASLNTANRTWDRVVSYDALASSIVQTEYDALTVAQRQYVDMVLQSEADDINGGEVRTGLLNIFGAGSTTRSNLAALANETISRAVELKRLNGLSLERDLVRLSDVVKARALIAEGGLG